MSKKLKVVVTFIAVCLGLLFVGTKAYATIGTGINDTTRIRKKANTTSEVVAIIDKGEKIEILSEEDGWYKVEYKNGNDKIIGYIRNDLLDVEGKTESKKEEKKQEEKTETTTKTEENKDETETKTENNEENVSEEVKEETDNKNDIVENTEIELKSEMDVQLLPVIFSCKTGKISANTKVTILEVVGNWTRVESENLEGWIPTSKLQNNEVSNKEQTNTEKKKEESKKEEKTETKIMYVNTVTLNVREKADTNSKIVTQLNQNDEVTVIKAVDNTWSKVKSGNYEGYTASQYLSNKKSSDTTSRGAEDTRNSEEAKKKAEEAKKKAEEEAKKKAEAEAKKKAEAEAKKKAEEAKKKAEAEAKKKTEAEAKKKETSNKSSDSSKTSKSSKKTKTTGEDIVAYAKKYLGCKYKYGATGPKTFDCSGFTQYVYKHFGYSISRTSSSQRSDGKVIKSKSDLQLGDIVCFPGHVGLYVGGGNFIHASHTGSDVKISSLSSSYYKNKFIQGTRVLNK